MLTASEVSALTSIGMGSLSIGASAGIVAVRAPEKVTTWSEPGTIAPPGPADRATCTSPISSGLEPYSLDRRSRISEPPPLTRTTWRMVWLSKLGLTGAKAAATRVGGRGEAPQIPAQPPAGWALEAPTTAMAARPAAPRAKARMIRNAISSPPALSVAAIPRRLERDFRSSWRAVYSPWVFFGLVGVVL